MLNNISQLLSALTSPGALNFTGLAFCFVIPGIIIGMLLCSGGRAKQSRRAKQQKEMLDKQAEENRQRLRKANFKIDK